MPIPQDCLFYGLSEKMTSEQRYMVNSIIDVPVVFSNSEAETGKTTMAYAALYYLYEKGVIDHIYYVMSPVEEGKMGFRPGTQEEKEEMYTYPIRDAIIKLNHYPEKALAPERGWVSAITHTFLRGRTLEKVGIILDEAQNYTRGELKKSITRVSDSCHMVVMGHEGQCDLKNPKDSGFIPCIELFSELSENKVRVCKLTKNFRGWISKHADKL